VADIGYVKVRVISMTELIWVTASAGAGWRGQSRVADEGRIDASRADDGTVIFSIVTREWIDVLV
jgi:hypothetical protein